MTAYLSGLTTTKNEKEIWWQDGFGDKITVELVDADLETYIVRRYSEHNYTLLYEVNFKKDQRHGPSKSYYGDGNLWIENNYLRDKRHGLCKEYSKNGRVFAEYNYHKDKLHGLCKYYNSRSGKIREEKYCKGKLCQ